MASMEDFDINGILSNLMRFEPTAEEKQKAQTMAMLKSGLGILAQGGPSMTPRSFGQIVGQAGQQGIGEYESQMKNMLQERRLGAQNALAGAQLARQLRMQPLEEEKLRSGMEAEKAQREYLQRPDVQEALQKGDINTVFSGLPHKTPADIMKFAENLRKQSDFKPIGSGGAIGPNGEMIAPMARPTMERKEIPGAMRQRISGDQLIEEEYQADGTWKELGKGPRFARQVPSIIAMGNTEKVPMGYRKTDTGLEPIPGGPADMKIQGQFNADTSALNNSISALDRLNSQVNLVKQSNLGRITGVAGVLPNIPGLAGADAKARLEALKAQVGFGVIQDMKNASKTASSGLGQITEKEHQLLQKQLGALDQVQSEEELRRVLDGISKFAEESKDRLRGAYNMRHEGKATQAPQIPSIDAIEAELARRKKR